MADGVPHSSRRFELVPGPGHTQAKRKAVAVENVAGGAVGFLSQVVHDFFGAGRIHRIAVRNEALSAQPQWIEQYRKSILAACQKPAPPSPRQRNAHANMKRG